MTLIVRASLNFLPRHLAQLTLLLALPRTVCGVVLDEYNVAVTNAGSGLSPASNPGVVSY